MKYRLLASLAIFALFSAQAGQTSGEAAVAIPAPEVEIPVSAPAPTTEPVEAESTTAPATEPAPAAPASTAAEPAPLPDPASTPAMPQSSAAPAVANAEERQEYTRGKAFVAEAAALEEIDRLDAAGASSVSLYVDAVSGALRLRSLTLAIDGGEPRHFEFGTADYGGLRRIARLHMSPAVHEIHIDFKVAGGEGSGDDAAMLALDGKLDASVGDQGLVLRLLGKDQPSGAHLDARLLQRTVAGAGWFAPSPHTESTLPTASYRVGSPDDPAMQYAASLLQAGDSDDALLEYIIMGDQVDDYKQLPYSYWLQTSAAYRQAGVYLQSEEICHLQAESGEHRQAVAEERLQLGEALFERGELKRAEFQLKLAHDRLLQYEEADWRSIYAEILLSQKRVTEALNLLAEPTADEVEAFRYMSQPDATLRSAGYRRYNLAVAMVQNGELQKGLSWLDLVGRTNTHDPELLALRDQANLTLGWHFLKAQQGRTAVGILGRVRSDSAWSNAALLGIGWAQLAPKGERQPRLNLGVERASAPGSPSALPGIMKDSLNQIRVLEEEERGKLGPKSFERADPPSDRKEGLQRAVQIWSVLMDRDPEDPAVQEGMLAIAYAYDQLDDDADAVQAYGRAAAALEATRSWMSAGLQNLRKENEAPAAANQGRAGARLHRLRIVPSDASRAMYVGEDDRVTLARQIVRLQALQQQLATSGAAAALQQRVHDAAGELSAARDAESAHVADLVAADLQRRGDTLAGYLKAAYLAQARIRDRPLADTR